MTSNNRASPSNPSAARAASDATAVSHFIDVNIPRELLSPSSSSDHLSTTPSEETTTSDTPSTELLVTGGTFPNSSGTATLARRKIKKLYLLLNWYLLLALARHDEKPIVDTTAKGRAQLFDAFMGGYISDNQDVTRLQPMRKSDGYRQFDADCARLVPELVSLVNEQNDTNFSTEPKNRMVLDTSSPPVRGELWKFVITPAMIAVFARLIKHTKHKDQLLKGNVDLWKYPEEHRLLIAFLNRIVEEQYDFHAWKHTEAVKPTFRQVKKLVGPGVTETFEWTADRLDEILAVVLAKVPGRDYHLCQTSFLPELNDYEEDLEDDDKPKVYFSPDPAEHMVPKKIKVPKTDQDMLWTPVDQKRKFWERADGKKWTCLLMTRKLAKHSNRYIRAHMLTLNLLTNIDPNDDDWKIKYNKFWRQIIRRDTGAILTSRERWAAEEKNVVFGYINEWCSVKGIDAFEDNCLSATEIGELAKKVNAVRSLGRQDASIRSFIHNQIKHGKHGFPALCDKAAMLRERLSNGEPVEEKERYPAEAIALLEIDDGDVSPSQGSKRKAAEQDVPLTEELRDYDLETDRDGAGKKLRGENEVEIKN